VATSYLYEDSHSKYRSLFTAIPATIMTAVVATYLFGEPNIALGRFIPFWVACIIGGTFALISFGVYLFYLFFHKNRHIIED
jgi:hypothetical protein